jgi:transcriptional regulator with XRE-family HTH domain
VVANDQLRRAIEASGLDLDELASRAAVDPKTVRRWLQGRIPHPRHRQLVAQLVNRSEYDLWPEHRQRDRIGEVIGAYPRRSDVHAPDWQSLLRAARQRIDMLGYTLHDVLGTPGIGELMAAKAASGVPVRLSIADASSDQAVAADLEHRPAGELLRRIGQARERLDALVETEGLEAREHRVATTHTILRFDEQMLVTVHLYATPGFQAPLIHLHRRRDFGIFDQFIKHFEDVWAVARPIGDSNSTRAEMSKQELLDSLDNVWHSGR